jgi:hypothetical protein
MLNAVIESNRPESNRIDRYVIDRYREAIQERVCVHCIDVGDDGSCRIAAGTICPFNQHLGKIISAVTNITSDRYEDYVPAIREQVCQFCANGNATICTSRDEIDCPLDRYYPLVEDAFEEMGFNRSPTPH